MKLLLLLFTLILGISVNAQQEEMPQCEGTINIRGKYTKSHKAFIEIFQYNDVCGQWYRIYKDHIPSKRYEIELPTCSHYKILFTDVDSSITKTLEITANEIDGILYATLDVDFSNVEETYRYIDPLLLVKNMGN